MFSIKWFGSSKIIIMIVIGIIAASFVFYLTVFTGTPDNKKISGDSKSNSKVDFPFHCRDLLPDADLQRITGLDPKVVEAYEDTSNFNRIPFACTWTRTSDVQSVSFSLEIEDGNWPLMHQMQVKLGDVDLPQIGYASFASIKTNSIYTLTSNKKYRLYSNVFTFGTESDAKKKAKFEMAQEIAKLVDKNLGKYS